MTTTTTMTTTMMTSMMANKQSLFMEDLTDTDRDTDADEKITLLRRRRMMIRRLLPSPRHTYRSSSTGTRRRCRYRSSQSSQSHLLRSHHLRRCTSRRRRLMYDDLSFVSSYNHRRHHRHHRHHHHHQLLLLLVQLLVLVCFSANDRSFMLKTTVAYMTRDTNHLPLFQQQHGLHHRRRNGRIRRFLIPTSIHSKGINHRQRTRRRPVVSLLLSSSSSNDLDETTVRNAYEEWRREYNKTEDDDSTSSYDDDDDDDDVNGKRYENFKRNYLRLQITNDDELREARANGQPDPIPLRLNEYADLSAEEYQSIVMMNNSSSSNNNSNKSSSSQPDQQQNEPSSSSPSPTASSSVSSSSATVENSDAAADDDETERERVRTLYREWCEVNSRQYDESRLPIFTKNLRAMERYQQKDQTSTTTDGNSSVSDGEGDDNTSAPPRLNKYADLRPDEYRTAVMMEQQSSPEMFGGSGGSSSTTSSSSSSQQQQQQQLGSGNSNNSNMVSPTPLTGYARSSSSYLEDLSSSVSSISSSNSPTTSSRLTSYASTPTNFGTVTGNTGSSYLDNLSGQSSSSSSSSSSSYSTPFMPPPPPPTTSSTGNTESSESGEARIRDVYQNWCKYYNKIPNERRLQRFADNLVILEKHFRDTGEQLTLNEYADQLGFEQRIIDDARRSAAEIEAKKAAERRKQRQREEAEKRKQAEEEQKRKAELAKKYEEDRRRAEEVRLEAEKKQAEQGRLEALRKQAEEAQQLEKQRQLEKSQYEERRREEASSLQSALVDEIAVPATSTTLSINEDAAFESTIAMAESEEEIEEEPEPEPIILPRGSYMDAVAKTWVDRSAYLKTLQQGKSTLLPDNTDEEPVRPVQPKIQKRSTQSLVDAMWKVMENPSSSPSPAETQDRPDEINEEIASDLIKEADEMIADARRSNTISKDELQNLKEAVDALRRRNEDERAAEEARIKAQEWKEIQVGLEKEARRAREVREYEERTAAEARENARSIESAGSNDPSDFEAQSNPFSNFFSSIQKDQMPDMSNSPFSFWGNPSPATDVEETPTVKSLTKPVVFKIQDSWLDRVFGFFGGKETQEEEELGQGTITLEAAKRKSVFDIFVSSDVLEPKQPGRGSIIIGEPEKPSILSFFANLGKTSQGDAEGNDQGAPTNPFASFFGDTKAIAAEVDPERLRKVENYESRRRSREDKVAWLEDQRSRILEQSDRKLSRKEARRLQREIDDLAVSSLSASAAVDQDIPQLAKWSKTPDGRITGYVSQSTSKYRRGTKITTNRVKGQAIKAGLIITTVSGSQYRLLMPLSNQYVDSLGQSAAASSSNASKLQQQRQQQEEETKPKQSSFQPLGSFIGGLFPNGDGGVGSSSIPTLVEWIQNEDGTLTGFVNNKEGFDDGTVITTSPVRRGARPGMVVQTGGGSKYRLLKQGKKRERR